MSKKNKYDRYQYSLFDDAELGTTTISGGRDMRPQPSVSEINAPVCIAGSIDSYQRLDEVKSAAPWAFTIGSAFFDHKFGEDFTGQINNVCEYIEK